MKDKIRELLHKRRAILLAHNYQPPEIQDIADLCGDSLELSIKASQTDADVIVFCGVHFMAETASILSPSKTVLLPKLNAGCPMADMITPEALQNKLKQMPNNIPVVTYVNSPASVKALSTICCTSANAVEVVQHIDAKEVLMTPDRNLAQYTSRFSDKKIHFWDGYCPIHNHLTVDMVIKAKKTYPNALFIAHPECPPDVLDLADKIMSTSGMLSFTKQTQVKEFIIGTEMGLLYPLQKENPDKTFYPASDVLLCHDMKKISLNDVLLCLENMAPVITVTDEIQQLALNAVQKMIAR